MGYWGNLFLCSFGFAALDRDLAVQPERLKEKTTFTLSITHQVGNQPLLLDSIGYKNELNQPFTCSRFRYYISGIRLKGESVTDYLSTDFFLIDEEDSLSKKLVFKNVPTGTYKEISFILGVDSLHKCSGTQSGALDPTKGMFWAWNTGYIFLKLEGISPVSKSPGHILEYHVGGYKQPSNCIRTIHLPIPSLSLKPQKNTVLTLKADVLEILKNPFPIDFSKLSSVVDFHNATLMAENYKDMFSVTSSEEKP
jgi:hypothetical protein